MSFRDITLVQLRALQAVGHNGSITAAAAALEVTQPVLTRSLRQLERQLGVTLLHRSPRGATLTGYGEALVARAERVDAEMQRAREEIDQMQGMSGGSVILACSPLPMMFFVPAAINQFQRDFPDVRLRVIETVYPEVTEELRQGRVDFAIGPVPEQGLGRDFKTATLLSAEMVVAVRRGHARAKARRLASLQDQDWMVMGPPGGPGAIVDRVFRMHGLEPPKTQLFMETVWAALEVIKHSDLAGFIARPLADRSRGDIEIVPVAEKLPSIRLDVVTETRAILTPAARTLVSSLRAGALEWKRRVIDRQA